MERGFFIKRLKILLVFADVALGGVELESLPSCEETHSIALGSAYSNVGSLAHSLIRGSAQSTTYVTFLSTTHSTVRSAARSTIRSTVQDTVASPYRE